MGMAVVADRPGSTLQFTRSNAGANFALAHVTGLVIALTPQGPFQPDIVTEQGTGIVTLTTAQWDSVAGTIGGLVIGDVYYLSDANNGNLVNPRPVTFGHYITQIGYALSPTQIQLQIGPPELITTPSIAAATVFSTGTFAGNHPGFSAVVHTGVGLYRLTLVNPPANTNNLVVEATLSSLIGEISWLVSGANTIDIGTFDSTGVAVDRNFSVDVYDVT